MEETQSIEVEANTVAQEQDQRDIRLVSASRSAAAVEAAYILEAVRK